FQLINYFQLIQQQKVLQINQLVNQKFCCKTIQQQYLNMDENSQQLPKKQLVFFKPKSVNQKYNKVINNFLIKSKNFDYLESCYKHKGVQPFDKSQLEKQNNFFKFTQPKIQQDDKKLRNQNKIQNENQQGKIQQSYEVESTEVKSQKPLDLNSDFNFQRNIKLGFPKSKSLYASPLMIPASNLDSLNEKFFLQNDDTTQGTFQIRSNSVSQNTTLYSNRQFSIFDNSIRRKSSVCQQNLDQDEILSQEINQQTNENLPLKINLLQQKEKLKDSLQSYQNYEAHSYNLKTQDQQNTQANQKCELSQSQQQFIKSKLIHKQNDQSSDIIKICDQQQNMPSLNNLMSQSNKSKNSPLQDMNNFSQSKNNRNEITLSKNIPKQKSHSMHEDNKNKTQNHLDQKYILSSKLFLEMHDQNKFSSHLNNLKQNNNQTKLLEDELDQYLPKITMDSQTQIKIKNNQIQSQYQNYYNQVCQYLNEFQNSLQEKNHIYDFKSYYNQQQESMRQEKKISQIQQMYNLHAHTQEESSPISKSDINFYKNLDQAQQFKVQQIYSLLLNLNQNFSHLVLMKRNKKKVMKALVQILGFNDQIKNTVLEEDQINVKKDIDFGLGLSIEAWKLVYQKNIKNIANLQKIPIETNQGIDYVPIDEAWQIYQIFQYFNQNLFQYIQIKLQYSERQRRNDLNNYLKDISSMRFQQVNKPNQSFKSQQQIQIFDKNVQDIFDRGQFVKQEQVVKRLEKYEITKGEFPFISQLSRLKSKQIDKAFDVFRKKIQK
ncbi:hypothetical protein TTHERM_01078010, partial (macronuclear) [Tetrahymena thermophila SB210]